MITSAPNETVRDSFSSTKLQKCEQAVNELGFTTIVPMSLNKKKTKCFKVFSCSTSVQKFKNLMCSMCNWCLILKWAYGLAHQRNASTQIQRSNECQSIIRELKGTYSNFLIKENSGKLWKNTPFIVTKLKEFFNFDYSHQCNI